jgi:hypothetical protein
MKRVVLAFTACLFAPTAAWAAAPGGTNDGNEVSYDPGPTLHRGGFAAGVSQRFGVVNYAGTELSVEALNDPSRWYSSGAQLGSATALWIGAAPRDFLTVALGVVLPSMWTGPTVGAAPAAYFHLDAYPLVALGGLYGDLGLTLEAGIGTGAVLPRDDLTKVIANGGAMAYLSAGLTFEAIHFWQFHAGPLATYSHMMSQTMNIDQVLLGFQVAFYGVAPHGAPSTKP